MPTIDTKGDNTGNQRIRRNAFTGNHHVNLRKSEVEKENLQQHRSAANNLNVGIRKNPNIQPTTDAASPRKNSQKQAESECAESHLKSGSRPLSSIS